MTTPAQMRSELANLSAVLLNAEIALDTNSVILHEKGDRIGVSWASRGLGTFGECTRQQFATIEEYQCWIRAQEYLVLLYDGSILQCSYEFEGRDIVKHRLLYYPCPFDLTSQQLQEEVLDDIVSGFIKAGGVSEVRLRTPIRFDYDLHARSNDHPTSHLTLLTENCRWPVVAPLSPGHFVRFVFRNFYPEVWKALPALQEWPLELGDKNNHNGR